MKYRLCARHCGILKSDRLHCRIEVKSAKINVQQINPFWISYRYHEEKKDRYDRFALLIITKTRLSDLRRRMIDHFAHDTKVFKIFHDAREMGHLLLREMAVQQRGLPVCQFLRTLLVSEFFIYRDFLRQVYPRDESRAGLRVITNTRTCQIAVPSTFVAASYETAISVSSFAREWLSTPREIISTGYKKIFRDLLDVEKARNK